MKYKHIEEYTLLRGFAIIFIIFYHYSLAVSSFSIRPKVGGFFINLYSFDVFKDATLISFIANVLNAIFSIGWQYVGVFIVLSGFGLTYSRLKRNSYEFYLFKRFKKLFPLWQIAILFAFLVNLLSLSLFKNISFIHQNGQIFDYVYLMLHPIVIDYEFTHIGAVNPSLWFIVLIIQFYIFYDILFYLFTRLKPFKFLILCFILTLIYRFVIIFFLNQQPGYIYPIAGKSAILFNFLPARLFEFVFGMVLADTFVKKRVNLLQKITPLMYISIIILWIEGNVMNWNPVGWIFSDLFITPTIFVITYKCISMIKRKRMRNILSSWGDYSYELYLFHNQPITQILLPLTMIVGYVMYPSVSYLGGIGLLSLFLIFLTTIFRRKNALNNS